MHGRSVYQQCESSKTEVFVVLEVTSQVVERGKQGKLPFDEKYWQVCGEIQMVDVNGGIYGRGAVRGEVKGMLMSIAWRKANDNG